MDKLLKPDKFSTLPNSKNATNEWRHWHRIFTSFLKSSSIKASDSLDYLVNSVSSSVFTYIADCHDYKSAITILQNLYDKEVNPIYARFLLTNRKQHPGESIDEFITNLQLLSHDCKYSDVSADQYRQEVIRDTFVSGINSPDMRLRLLETSKTSLHDIISLARNMEAAHQNANAYTNHTPGHTNIVNSHISIA
jgi:hypothetical protein